MTMLTGVLSGSYQTAQAAEFVSGAAAAEESLQFIFSIMAGMGMSISLKELFRPREAEIKKDLGVQSIDWDNYDWGNLVDSPAAQDQIDQTEKWINELYGNASETWKKKYQESLSPTPKPDPTKPPEVSPPVTVPPIDPDSVTPPAWNDLKRAALKNKYLTLGAATYWCLKEAVTGFWDKLMDNSVPSKDLHGNSLINTSKLVGKVTSTYHCNPSNNGYDHYNTYYIYDFYGHSDLVFYLFFNKSSGLDEAILYSGYNKDGEFVHDRDVAYYALWKSDKSIFDKSYYGTDIINIDSSHYQSVVNNSYEYQFYVPYFLNGTLLESA